MASNASVDVVVVGAGLAGASTAWELTRRGRSVVLLEQFTVDHECGSSHGTSRIFRRAYADPFYVHLTGRANERWKLLEAQSGLALRTFTGGLDTGGSRKLSDLVQLLRSCGVAADLLPAAEVAARWPGCAVPGPAVFHPDAGYLNADATVRAMVQLAVASGAELRERTAFTRVEPVPGGVVVHTSAGSVRAQEVVVSAGAWLAELAGGLGGSIPLPVLQVKQQEVFHFRQRDPHAAYPTLVYKDAVQLYALPSGADGGREPAMKFGQFDSQSTTTATTRDGVIDSRARAVVRGYVEGWMPGLIPEPVAEQSCLFTMTPDEDFVLDRVELTGGGGLVVASPCSGHGAKFAPLIGELVADLVDGQPADSRFALST